ncbi:MAG TPA: hypothetical protein VK892_11310 [Pyrinomonadaceae bacterium]|nr:hypothetical protein [Pyrinomonadaceae bacterium]
MKKYFNGILLLIFFLLFNSAGLSNRVQTETSENQNQIDAGSFAASASGNQDSGATETEQTQDEIRKIDFKNFTYEPFCAGVDDEAMKVAVKNGEFSEEKEADGFTERFYFNVFDVGYGDLTGDNRAEAIVLTVCNTGGTGNFSEGFVYTMKDGKPSLLTRIEGGDRAYGGLRSAKVENGTLIVDRNDVGEEGGACCPEFAVATTYKLSGSRLVPTGKETRRELYPARRVSFEKGKSSGIVSVKIPANERQRFVVEANRGQTMTVRVNSDKAAISLRKGDAETTESAGLMRAVLKERGDFVFEVWNNGENEAEFTVTIEIK